METVQSDFDQKHTERQLDTLKQLDDETLETMKQDALENCTALEKLILTISRIQDEREQDTLF